MQTACSVLYWYDVSGLSFFLSQVCCNAQTRQIAHLWPGFCWGTHNAASLVPQSAEMGPSPSTPLVPTLNQSRLLCSALSLSARQTQTLRSGTRRDLECKLSRAFSRCLFLYFYSCSYSSTFARSYCEIMHLNTSKFIKISHIPSAESYSP